MCFFVQTNHTRKELLFLMFKEINLRNHSSLHKLFYSLNAITVYVRDCLRFLSGEIDKVKIEMELIHEVPNDAINDNV